MKLLILEEEQDLVKALTLGLRKEGYAVDVAMDSEESFLLTRTNEYDLFIMGLDVQGTDGIELCRRVRDEQPQLAILILTVRNHPADRIAGLDAGADDYLVKPFHWGEFLARVRALLRRCQETRNTVLQVGDIQLDTVKGKVMRGEREVELTPKEFAILEYLMLHNEAPVSQRELLAHVWDNSSNTLSNAVRVHVNALRNKLDSNIPGPPSIETVVGKGYRLRAP